MMIRNTLAGWTAAVFGFGALAPTGCASAQADIAAETEPSAEEQAGFAAEAKAEIDAKNAAAALDELSAEIDGDDER